MFGRIRRHKKANFHNIADLAKSDNCTDTDHTSQLNCLSHCNEQSELFSPEISLGAATSINLRRILIATHTSHTPCTVVRGGLRHNTEPPQLLNSCYRKNSGYINSASPTSHLINNDEGCSKEDIQSKNIQKYRKQRMVFESSQLKMLENTFAVNPYPSSEEYEILSEKSSIDEARLRIWFQNRRARYRRSAKNSPPPPTSGIHTDSSAAQSTSAVCVSGYGRAVQAMPRFPGILPPHNVIFYRSHPTFFAQRRF